VSNAQSGKIRIKILMADSIVCSERTDRTSKVLVLKMNAKTEMVSINEDFLKDQLTR